MFQILAVVLTWVVWFGSVALIIRIDAKQKQAAKRAIGEVDFMDRSVMPYLILAIFCGALPLVVYFGVTRRSAKGWLMGVGIFLAHFVAITLVSTVLMIVAKPLDAMIARRPTEAPLAP